MAAPHVEIRGTGSAVAVYVDGKRASRYYSGGGAAEAAANAIEAQLKVRIVPCICCRFPMRSTGPHHRMCDPCRARAERFG